jgi:hypothetical protein
VTQAKIPVSTNLIVFIVLHLFRAFLVGKHLPRPSKWIKMIRVSQLDLQTISQKVKGKVWKGKGYTLT